MWNPPFLSPSIACTPEFAIRYIKTMEKIEAKGASYPKDETVRIEKLLGGSLSDAKKDDLRNRWVDYCQFMLFWCCLAG